MISLSALKQSLVIFVLIVILSIFIPSKKSFSVGQHQTKSSKWNYCQENPFLQGYSRDIIDDYELEWKLWYRSQFTRTFDFLRKYAQSPSQAVGEFPDMIYPSISFLPCPYNRNQLKRYGNSRATGKLLCGLETLSENDNCRIFSLGSNNEFDFENDVLSHTWCHIYTFDCTSSPPKRTHKRLKFYPICLGEKSPLQKYIYPQSGKISDASNRTYISYDRLLKLTNLRNVHVLKMDIEGGEYSVFADLLKNPNRTDLPFQISFESHWWNADIYHGILHMSLFSQLWRSGYRLLQYELNPGDPACAEWTFLRVFC